MYHIHHHYSPAFGKICVGTVSMHLTSKSKFGRAEHVFSVVKKVHINRQFYHHLGKCVVLFLKHPNTSKIIQTKWQSYICLKLFKSLF